MKESGGNMLRRSYYVRNKDKFKKSIRTSGGFDKIHFVGKDSIRGGLDLIFDRAETAVKLVGREGADKKEKVRNGLMRQNGQNRSVSFQSRLVSGSFYNRAHLRSFLVGEEAGFGRNKTEKKREIGKSRKQLVYKTWLQIKNKVVKEWIQNKAEFVLRLIQFCCGQAAVFLFSYEEERLSEFLLGII